MMPDLKVEAYFEKLEGEVQEIALALRALMNTRDKTFTVQLAWGFPSWSGNERILSIIAHKDRCNLQLWSGNRLAGKFPERIEGTGKQMRHVKVHALSEIDAELITIIEAAIRLDATDPERVA